MRTLRKDPSEALEEASSIDDKSMKFKNSCHTVSKKTTFEHPDLKACHFQMKTIVKAMPLKGTIIWYHCSTQNSIVFSSSRCVDSPFHPTICLPYHGTKDDILPNIFPRKRLWVKTGSDCPLPMQSLAPWLFRDQRSKRKITSILIRDQDLSSI